MHERERWQLIVQALHGRHVVTVRELVERTGVSPATLRRDLTKLAEDGRIRRVHGGVEAIEAPARPHLSALPFDVGQTRNIEHKRQIARAAAAMCMDGESIIINGGTTTYQMVDFLAGRRLQILTNSFPIAQILILNSDNRIAIPGGEIYREQGLIISPFDSDAAQHFAASKIFVSCFAVNPRGVIESDPLVARAVIKLLDRADQLILLADSSKFVSAGSMAVCPLSRVGTLITDAGIDEASAEMVRAAGVKLVIAEADALSLSSAA